MAITDKKLAKKYTQLISSSYDRGLSFDLSLVKLRRVMNAKQCYFTGVPLTDATRSIDRLDSSIGYEDSNIFPCHTSFNQMKSYLESRDNNPEITTKIALKGLQKVYKLLKER